VGTVGNYFAGTLAEIQASAGVRPLGTARCGAEIIGDSGASDICFLLHAMAYEQPLKISSEENLLVGQVN
jgi:hypothetical protein